MKTTHEIHIREIFFIIIIIVLSIFLTRSYYESVVKDKDLEFFRKEQILKNNILQQEAENRWSKLVNDYNTEQSLLDSLKVQNSDLYEDLKQSNRRIVSMSRAIIELKKVETYKEFEDGETLSTFIYPGKELLFNYPNDEEPLISHSLLFKNSGINSSWKSNPISIDLVVSETEQGIFKASLGTNKWVNIKSLDVNTLPRTSKQDDNYKRWGFGGIIQKNFSDNSLSGTLITEYTFGKSRNWNLVGSLSTDTSVGVGLIKH